MFALAEEDLDQAIEDGIVAAFRMRAWVDEATAGLRFDALLENRHLDIGATEVDAEVAGRRLRLRVVAVHRR